MLHKSYSFVLAFEPDLVSKEIQEFKLSENSRVLDPFCGTGTTLLECKIAGIPSIGIDANPVCVLLSDAKVNWSINAARTERLANGCLQRAKRNYVRLLRRVERGTSKSIHEDRRFRRSRTGRYLVESGLIKRRWIGIRPAAKTLLLAEEITCTPRPERNFLLLALLGILVPGISNMAYGPEIYRARERRDCDVFGKFRRRLIDNLHRLRMLRRLHPDTSAQVRYGDATQRLRGLRPSSIDAVISSPPYLSDHDYTRMMRLELVFAGCVTSGEELREVKLHLLRSSSKNVYKQDHMSSLVKDLPSVQWVIHRVRRRARTKKNGFARVYPKLVGEYFGGMFKHFEEVSRVVKPGGWLAYIVGDQSSFFAIPIKTSEILVELAERAGGLRLVSKRPIKVLRGTRGAVRWKNREWLIVLRKPKGAKTQT